MLLLVGVAHGGRAQVGALLYDSIPRHALDTLPVWHEYNRHMFFGYDNCEEYTALKYGFRDQYYGRVARISMRRLVYQRQNQRLIRRLTPRNGPGWLDKYYEDLRRCRDDLVFREFSGALSDSAFARLQSISSKAELLQVPPVQFLRYLTTTMQHYGRAPDGQSVALEMRRDVKFLVTPQDKWVSKADVATLIPYIYADQSPIRRACLCPDTVLLGEPSSLALEAYKLIALYRGHDYPTSFARVSQAEVAELFAWWLEERKKP